MFNTVQMYGSHQGFISRLKHWLVQGGRRSMPVMYSFQSKPHPLLCIIILSPPLVSRNCFIFMGFPDYGTLYHQLTLLNLLTQLNIKSSFGLSDTWILGVRATLTPKIHVSHFMTMFQMFHTSLLFPFNLIFVKGGNKCVNGPSHILSFITPSLCVQYCVYCEAFKIKVIKTFI